MSSMCVEPSRTDRQAEEDLLRLASDGNRNAIEILLVRYKHLVEARARSYFLIGADHDDVVQEGMIGLYKAIRDFRDDRAAGFRSFADLCITRQIISAVKTATRNKHLPLNAYVSFYRSPAQEMDSDMWLLDSLPDAQSPSPYDLLFGHSAANRLEAARGALSLLEESVLEGYLQGKSYREISVELRKPAKTVDNALQRVKRKLLETIAPEN